MTQCRDFSKLSLALTLAGAVWSAWAHPAQALLNLSCEPTREHEVKVNAVAGKHSEPEPGPV